jgi:hypothetical protein
MTTATPYAPSAAAGKGSRTYVIAFVPAATGRNCVMAENRPL